MIPFFGSRVGLVMAVFLALLAAGCTPAKARLLPTPTPIAVDRSGLPEKNTSVLVRPEDGGVVGLRDGAEVVLPRQSLTDSTLVGLRAVDPHPVSLPRSLIGQAYDVSFDGGSMVGLGTLVLPLPTGVMPDQYDLGAYRWDGGAWQHADGRYQGEALRVGINGPGIFAVLGVWRMADAALSLALPPVEPGSPAMPVEVRGQYSFTAPPLLDHEVVQARLSLKRDSSGGAGQVKGDDALDQTVADTVLFFQPDPGQSQGAIDFTYTFQIDPAALHVPLGSVNTFYASLLVMDSPAPTRRLSTGVTYTAQVPIRGEGTEIVRPDLPGDQQTLQWVVRLNGETLLVRPATELTLSLAEVLAQGGLGEYKVVLEAESQGQFVPVSNEVTVQLTLPSTATATPEDTPTPAVLAQRVETPFPFGTMPPTPTRRPQPRGTPSPLERPTPAGGLPQATVEPEDAPAGTPSPAPSATPTRATAGGIFWADRESLAPGECTTLRWKVENVTAVYFNGGATEGIATVQVCPQVTTSYTLSVVDRENKTQDWRIVVSVAGTPSEPAIEFSADQSQVSQGQCTTLRWNAVNVTAVYLNDQGVAGVATREVCPQTTTTYVLKVVGKDDETIARRLTIYVVGAGAIPVSFWAEQYVMDLGSCTTLHWDVENVETVRLRGGNADSGVAGNGTLKVCPVGRQTYSLVVTASEDRHVQKDLILLGGVDPLKPGEVMAQGEVTEVTEVTDLDPGSAGDLPGYVLVVEGVAPLYKGFDGCCQSRMTIRLPKTALSGSFQPNVDWPIQSGQLIEFFFPSCTASECNFFNVKSGFYLKLRSN